MFFDFNSIIHNISAKLLSNKSSFEQATDKPIEHFEMILIEEIFKFLNRFLIDLKNLKLNGFNHVILPLGYKGNLIRKFILFWDANSPDKFFTEKDKINYEICKCFLDCSKKISSKYPEIEWFRVCEIEFVESLFENI